MAHADIRKEFTVGGRKFEAVGFILEDEETTVDGDTMVTRTDAENGGGLGQEDGEFLWEYRSELLKKLRNVFKHYHLVFTKWCNPADPRLVQCFYGDAAGLGKVWNDLRTPWSVGRLVVRRLA